MKIPVRTLKGSVTCACSPLARTPLSYVRKQADRPSAAPRQLAPDICVSQVNLHDRYSTSTQLSTPAQTCRQAYKVRHECGCCCCSHCFTGTTMAWPQQRCRYVQYTHKLASKLALGANRAAAAACCKEVQPLTLTNLPTVQSAHNTHTHINRVIHSGFTLPTSLHFHNLGLRK